MKNYEKYADKIRSCSNGNQLCTEIKIPLVLKLIGKSCASDTDCTTCATLTTLWLLEEYKEPEVDWDEIAVDTPILVRNHAMDAWTKRHFAKYEDGKVYVWESGETSWTTKFMSCWEFAKLGNMKDI